MLYLWCYACIVRAAVTHVGYGTAAVDIALKGTAGDVHRGSTIDASHILQGLLGIIILVIDHVAKAETATVDIAGIGAAVVMEMTASDVKLHITIYLTEGGVITIPFRI